LARRHPVDAPVRREHLREPELLAGRAELVAEARALVLRDDRAAAGDELDAERVAVDAQLGPAAAAARSAAGEREHERGARARAQPAHTSSQATSRSVSRSPSSTGVRRRASARRIAAT